MRSASLEPESPRICEAGFPGRIGVKGRAESVAMGVLGLKTGVTGFSAITAKGEPFEPEPVTFSDLAGFDMASSKGTDVSFCKQRFA